MTDDSPPQPEGGPPVTPESVASQPATPEPMAADPGRRVFLALERLSAWLGTSLARPTVRTATVGVGLILIAALFIKHSFWTFPILILGILMVIVAWMGGRFEGRFAIEWGEFGAGFELRARVKAPAHRHARAGQLAFGSAERRLVPAGAPTSNDTQETLVEAARGWVADAETIEAESHTAQIGHLETLRAVVTAAESADTVADA